MKLIMTSVYDAAVKAFNTPLCFRSKGEAIRAFSDACADEKSNFWRHAADYSLMEIGEFNDADGSISVLMAPGRIVSALECVPSDFGLAQQRSSAVQ